MARRAVISPGVLKGYLLEEVVASLIRNAGYRLLTRPEDDPHDLSLMSNGLQVRGRGGFHQADVLGELTWAPAFGNPIRLFIEAKWRGQGRARVGIPEARHAVGILQDVNQVLVTVQARPAGTAPGLTNEDVTNSGRGFCYSYRYALCSTSGFSPGAQAYALAHQVALLDLSHQEYDELRSAIDTVGDDLHDYIESTERTASASAPPRGRLVRRIRATLRRELWGLSQADAEGGLLPILQPLLEAAWNIGELFVGVSATGFVILLKADHRERMIRHMQAPADPWTSIHYQLDENGASNWRLTVSSTDGSIEPCRLFFALPDAMLRVLDEQAESSRRRAAALNLKAQHFSRITVYRITDEKSLICSLRLDEGSLVEARRRLEGHTPR
ncbi:hypothetical protein IVA98_08880 [Bradyrhizobium sp. 160]|uniref:hypothetical protein n=1 Tax=Bradyrhizobium sp. 160 TaxID=2782634 RepID=UPI001FF88339|nr:hypothetical protein [Bradyrhizobium sp. 160]MCK1623334.1 hypothetical protein [Bradyrhizobium sp. 160]